MKTEFVSRKRSTGTTKKGGVPKKSAIPSVTKIKLKYIGLRVCPKGPRVTSALLVGDVGMISVPAAANMRTAQTAIAMPETTSAIAVGVERISTTEAQANP